MAKTQDLLKSIATTNPNEKITKSISWFNSIIPKLLSAKRNSPMKVGKMYTFAYDPLYKENIPYWDRFPLIILIEIRKETVVGINLHYVPTTKRIELLTKLIAAAGGRNLNSKSVMKDAHRVLRNYPNSMYMIKQYHAQGVKSAIMEIPGEMWGMAITLPLAEFKNGNPESNKMKHIEKQMFKHGKTETKQMVSYAEVQL